MNKTELIDAIASNTGLSKADASRAVDALIDSVTGALKGGSKVTIPGFLTLEKSRREARTGRNPSTGETIKIAAKNVVKVKAGKTLQESVN
jgi:DNA-binding protein HU-beta